MRRVMVVEDHEMSRTMLTRRLHRLGYEVAVALDGREAVLKAGAWQPDVIIMDLSMPGMDGWAAARQLKKDPKAFRIPVIALTASAMLGDRERALEAGCDEYETKPVNFERLLTKMEGLSQAEARA